MQAQSQHCEVGHLLPEPIELRIDGTQLLSALMLRSCTNIDLTVAHGHREEIQQHWTAQRQHEEVDSSAIRAIECDQRRERVPRQVEHGVILLNRVRTVRTHLLLACSNKCIH